MTPRRAILASGGTLHRPRSNRTRGFSLLELVLVLGILVTISAIVLPRYGTAVARYRADAAARRVVADLGFARTTAYETSRMQVVDFNLYSDQIVIPYAAGLDSTSSLYVTDLRDEPYRGRLVYASFAGDPAVVFNIYGIPDSGGEVIIKVGNIQKTIVLDADTGEASVQ